MRQPSACYCGNRERGSFASRIGTAAGPVRVSLESAVQAAGGTGQLADQFTDLQPLLCGPEVERLWKRCASVGNKAHRN